MNFVYDIEDILHSLLNETGDVYISVKDAVFDLLDVFIPLKAFSHLYGGRNLFHILIIGLTHYDAEMCLEVVNGSIPAKAMVIRKPGSIELRTGKSQVKVSTCDLETSCPPYQFDMIVGLGLIQCTDNEETRKIKLRSLESWKNCLKQDGRMCIMQKPWDFKFNV